jgi:hypothetical protein
VLLIIEFFQYPAVELIKALKSFCVSKVVKVVGDWVLDGVFMEHID